MMILAVTPPAHYVIKPKQFAAMRSQSRSDSTPIEAKMATTPENNSPLKTRVSHYIANVVIYGFIKLALLLPYKMRVRLVGGLFSHVIGPAVGFRKRAIQHLAHVFPDMDKAKRKSIATACLNNSGRTLIENYSTRDMLLRMKNNPISGEGLAALEKADEEGRPVIMVSGHLGNYEATRAAVVMRGFNVGGLYRNMTNPYFNRHYVRTMEAYGGPFFSQGRGTSGFVKYLKGGGQVVLLFDQHVFGAPVMDFMGKPARTAMSAAKLATRFNAVLIPYYGIRQPDGFSFETVLEAPIPHGDPLEMTQALNESLGKRIKDNPEQWFWVHRRWRPDSN
jgi:KDO2-lipid IV(A) lauroyltransferase